MGLPYGENCIFQPFLTVPCVTDGQTDGHMHAKHMLYAVAR